VTVPMDCRLIGRWRIVEADLWDRAHLDLVEPAMMTIGAHGRGEITFGAVQGGLELEYARSTVFLHLGGVRGDGPGQRLGIGRAERRRLARDRVRLLHRRRGDPESRSSAFFNSLLGRKLLKVSSGWKPPALR
jgi:hypothetical protein